MLHLKKRFFQALALHSRTDKVKAVMVSSRVSGPWGLLAGKGHALVNTRWSQRHWNVDVENLITLHI